MVESNETRTKEEQAVVAWFTKKLKKRKARYEERKGTEDEAECGRWWCWLWKCIQAEMREDGYNEEPLREFEPPVELLQKHLFEDFEKLSLKED